MHIARTDSDLNQKWPTWPTVYIFISRKWIWEGASLKMWVEGREEIWETKDCPLLVRGIRRATLGQAGTDPNILPFKFSAKVIHHYPRLLVPSRPTSGRRIQVKNPCSIIDLSSLYFLDKRQQSQDTWEPPSTSRWSYSICWSIAHCRNLLSWTKLRSHHFWCFDLIVTWRSTECSSRPSFLFFKEFFSMKYSSIWLSYYYVIEINQRFTSVKFKYR